MILFEVKLWNFQEVALAMYNTIARLIQPFAQHACDQSTDTYAAMIAPASTNGLRIAGFAKLVKFISNRPMSLRKFSMANVTYRSVYLISHFLLASDVLRIAGSFCEEELPFYQANKLD